MPNLGVSTEAARSSIFTLNCWILCDNTDHVFPVEISREKSVGVLKDAIKDKKQHRLHEIDADSLTLWKVSLRIGSNVPRLISLGRFPSLQKIVRRYSKDVTILRR